MKNIIYSVLLALFLANNICLNAYLWNCGDDIFALQQAI